MSADDQSSAKRQVAGAEREILRTPGRVYRWGHVLAGAFFRGDAQALSAEVSDLLAVAQYADEEGFDFPEDAGGAGEAFRLEHELITGEELERWLDRVGITLEQFDRHFASRALLERFRGQLAEIRRDYASAEGDVLDRMWVATILSGRFEALAVALARRLAARLAAGNAGTGESARVGRPRADNVPAPLRSPGLVAELAEMEAAYVKAEAECTAPERLARELKARAQQLTRLAYVEAVFPSLDQAKEAYLSVSADGLPFEKVVEEAGAEALENERFPDEVTGEGGGVLLTAATGKVLPPEEVDAGYALRLLRRRIEPTLEDPSVVERVRERLVAAHFDALVERLVTWEFDPWAAA